MKLKQSCIIAGLLSCLLPTFSTAQELKPCGNAKVLRELYAKHPELQQANQELLENSRQLKQNRDGSSRSVYVIPMVFHIIHEYGTENISDAQVLDQVSILNRDYNKQNADTASVVPEFDTIISNVGIQFKLATIDFQGNCTNGIEHIYSHETNIGDDRSKLNQWPQNKYLNVWVVKSMRDGVAGYAYYPSAISGFMVFADGVIILQDYIGSIGTSSVGSSRALTHEIGHYLGLSHVWGDTNDPMLVCGDDGFDDTPETKGWDFCPIVNYQTTSDVCNPGIPENFQNYMDYSYCSKMFTLDQGDYMNITLATPTAGRDNLVTAANLTAVGADVTVAPLCSPVADFFPSEKFVCSGESVTFTSTAWRAAVSNYSWSFPTGTPSTSTSANPTVTFNGPGYHKAELTVSNATGSDTKTMLTSVWVSYPWVDNIGPKSEDFEGATGDDWLVENPEENAEKWQLYSGVGASGTHCYKLNNFYNGSSFDPFYQERIGGNKDALISPAFDLSNTTSAVLTFKYAAATKTSVVDDMTDELKVWTSIDCGKTWVLRKTLSGLTLMTAGYTGNNYVPSNSNEWGTSTYTVAASALQDNVRFKFEYTSSDYANNVFIDDINISGVLSTGEVVGQDFSVKLFPNPISNSQDLYLQYDGEGKTNITITDIGGKVIYSEVRMNTANEMIVLPSSKIGLSSGAYFITVSNDKSNLTKKLIVL